MANTTRRKGFSILSFLLGIILGMILLVGIVAGVGYYALTTDVDSALKLAGLENKDENGNYIYVNTDLESGGAKSLLDLFDKVMQFTGDPENLSVGEVEKLLPAVKDMVDQLHTTINEFIPMERNELLEVKFSGLEEFVKTKVYDIQPAVLFGNLGMSGLVENKIISLVFLGSEADYVVNGGVKYPVYYDAFELVDGAYLRKDDGLPLPAEYSDNLYLKGEEYRLYYYIVDGTPYITDDGYTYYPPVAKTRFGGQYSSYTPEYAKLTGYYYMNGDERVVVTPITVGALGDGQLDMLDDIYLTELLSESNELAEKVFGEISLGNLMNEGVDFEVILNGLYVGDIVKTKVDDSIMANLVWKIKDIVAQPGEDYTHIGKYTADERDVTLYINTEQNASGDSIIESAYYIDGQNKVKVNSVTIGNLMDGFGVDEVLNDITLADFIDIKATDAILSYLGYGIYGIKQTDGVYTAKYEIAEGGVLREADCFIETSAEGENVLITSCYYQEDGARIEIPCANVQQLSDRISTVTKKLTLGEFIGETDDPVLKKLGGYTLDNVSEAINTLTIGDVLTNADDNKLLSNLKDTPLSELPTKINTLKMSDILEIDEDNLLLSGIKDATLETLPEVINTLNINELYAKEIYKVKTGEDESGNAVYADGVRKQAVSVVTDPNTQIAFNESYVYYTRTVADDGSEKFTLVNIPGNALGKITAQQFAALGGEYYTYGEANGVWQILLYNEDSESVYTVNNLAAMMDNVSKNMSHSTLRQLHEIGVLVIDKPEFFDNKLYYLDSSMRPVQSDKAVGDMELIELINFIINNISRG